ncbi:hypothetical protein M5689_008399 [Euphorbia peplus]|nr:hypothetical protein M5689_008399 [Euphorbia peplus]
MWHQSSLCLNGTRNIPTGHNLIRIRLPRGTIRLRFSRLNSLKHAHADLLGVKLEDLEEARVAISNASSSILRAATSASSWEIAP